MKKIKSYIKDTYSTISSRMYNMVGNLGKFSVELSTSSKEKRSTVAGVPKEIADLRKKAANIKNLKGEIENKTFKLDPLKKPLQIKRQPLSLNIQSALKQAKIPLELRDLASIDPVDILSALEKAGIPHIILIVIADTVFAEIENLIPELHEREKQECIELYFFLKSVGIHPIEEFNIHDGDILTIKEIHERFFDKINILDLKSKKISTLPEGIGRLKNLLTLNLDENNLESLPNSICYLTKLSELSINSNKIVKLPESFSKLKNLKEFSAYLNQLKHLPSSIGDIANLQRIDVAANKLTKLPNSLEKLVTLKHLSAEGNDITDVPESLFLLNSIKKIHLNQNKISEKIKSDLKKFVEKNNPNLKKNLAI